MGLLILATLAALTGPTAQEAAPPIVIESVEIKGLGRFSESLVRAQIEVKPGDPLDPGAVARDLERFMKLDLFATVRADLETATGKNILVYTVQEEQTIRDIRIAGNKKIKERQIRGAIQWHEGRSFYREAYGEERDAVLALYRSKGFLNTTVEIVVEPVAPGEVRVTYAIAEGKKARISQVNFVGNEALGRRKLKKVVKTRPSFLFFGGRYDQDKFENDLVQVLNAYGDVGRLEARIAATDFNYSKNGKKLSIDIGIAEGPEYHLDTLDLADNVAYRDDELLPRVKVKPGDVHNRGQVAADAESIQKLYRDSGYVKAQVLPQVTLDREKHTTKVSHQVQEDELRYLREVRVTGNSITRDEVVRRNILLKPGERYDGSLKDASDRRLESSQYFESHQLRLGNVEENDRFVNLLADVVEGKTGDFNFGAAFNTDEGIGGFGEMKLRNFDLTDWPTFSGGGQILNASTFIGTNRTSYRLGLTDPEFLGYPFSLGVDVFKESFTGTGRSDFTTDSVGTSVRLGKRLSLYNSVSVGLSFSDTSISNLNTFVDPGLRELDDPGSTLGVTLGLNRNTTNSFRNPTGGSDHSINLEVAGLGLENDFAGLQHDSTWYYGVKRWDRIAFSLRAREGILYPYGDKEYVPINERFFAGGSGTLRGYDFRDVGPRADTFRIVNGVARVDDQPIGGELRLLQSFETKFRVTEILRLYYFVDAGAVFFKPEDFNVREWQFSTGVGVGIDVPFLGPIRVDYGYPLNPDGSQGNGQLHLQSSVRF